MIRIDLKSCELNRADLDVILGAFLKKMGYDESACECVNKDIAAGILLGLKFFIEIRNSHMPAILTDKQFTTMLLLLLRDIAKKHLPDDPSLFFVYISEMEQHLASQSIFHSK